MSHPLTPEVGYLPQRCVVVGPDDPWCESVGAWLETTALAEPSHSHLRWRHQYGLIKLATPQEAEQAIAAANESTETGLARPMTLWAALSPEDWRQCARSCPSLRSPDLHGLSVHYLPPGANTLEELLDLVEALREPDTLPDLYWRTHGRFNPVPKEWLGLAALPGQSPEQHLAMAEQGHTAFQAWATAFLAANDQEDLIETWGPFSAEMDGDDDEQDGPLGDDKGDIRHKDNVRQLPSQMERAFALLLDGTRGSSALGALGEANAKGTSDDLNRLLDQQVLKEWRLGERAPIAIKLRTDARQLGRNLDALFFFEWRDVRDSALLLRTEQVQLQTLWPTCPPWLFRGKLSPDEKGIRFALPVNLWPSAVDGDPQKFKAWLLENCHHAKLSLLQASRPLARS